MNCRDNLNIAENVRDLYDSLNNLLFEIKESNIDTKWLRHVLFALGLGGLTLTGSSACLVSGFNSLGFFTGVSMSAFATYLGLKQNKIKNDDSYYFNIIRDDVRIYLSRIRNLFENETIKNFLNDYIIILENAKDEDMILKEFNRNRNSFIQAIQYTFKQIQNQIPSQTCDNINKLSDYVNLDEAQKKEFSIRFENALYAVINRRVYGRININLILKMIAINLICFLYDLAQDIRHKDNRLVHKIQEFLNLFEDLTLHIEYNNFY